MATSNTKPSYIPLPFANEGQKNEIPVNDSGTYAASWAQGFPSITQEPLSEGGLPPDRKDVNGVCNKLSAMLIYQQNGGVFTYDANLAAAIGGYAKDQVLYYNDGTSIALLKSTKNNNSDNFLTNPSFIGTSWVKVFPTMTDLNTKVPASIGSGVKPVYTNESGVITASNSTVGSLTAPVYMNAGTLTQCNIGTKYVGFPNYSAGTRLGTNTASGTVSQNGWINFWGTARRGGCEGFINNIRVVQSTSDADGSNQVYNMVPVKAGDTWKSTGTIEVWFYPMR